MKSRVNLIRLTEDNICELLSDIKSKPVFVDHSTIRHDLFLGNGIRPSACLICVMDIKKDPYFFDLKIGEEAGILSFSDGNIPFDHCYFVQGKEKIKIEFWQELKVIIDSLRIKTRKS